MKLLSDVTESLVAMGHEVTVLTGFPNWPTGKIYPGYRQRLVQRETVNGVRIIRIPLYPDHSGNPLKRAANFLSFALSATVLGPFLAPQVDIMHVIHPPITVGFPAWILSRLRGFPFTIEIQDLWPENLRSTGMLNNETLLRLVGAFARAVYRSAAAIRVISPGFRLNLLSKGVPNSKIVVISNWVDTDYYKPVRRDPVLAGRFDMTGCFNVLYAGTVGLAQGLGTVLDAAALLRDEPRIQFVIAGDGIELDRLSSEASSRGLANVRFLGRLPGDMMPSLYACSDVLFLHLRADPLFRITIPHKLFTYLAAGKPILAGAEGDVAATVASCASGIACRPGAPRELAEAVLRFYRMDPLERERMGTNARQAACRLFNRESLTHQMFQMMYAAAGGPGRCHE